MSFAEVLLDLGIDYGAVGGPRFSTTVVEEGGGAEQRNINWTQPLGQWQLGQRTIDKDDLDYLLQFHRDRKGSAQGFRFRDWSDFWVENQLLGVGNGVRTQFQLRRTYTAGGHLVNRPITKPTTNRLRVFFGTTQQLTGWTLNLTNGLLSFATPPANGIQIFADFEFDVPVRFEQDTLQTRLEAIDDGDSLHFLESLSVVEVRVPPGQYLPFDPVPQSLALTIDLGYDLDTVGGPAYNTAISPSASGYERRDSNWQSPRRRWNLGDRDLDEHEQLDWLSLFRVCRGAAVGFNYRDHQQGGVIVPVRFESDSLALRFEAIEPSGTDYEAIFYLAGVPVVERVTGVAAEVPVIGVATEYEDACIPSRYRCQSGACIRDPSGPYPDRLACESAIIPASFTGGQCLGVRYLLQIPVRLGGNLPTIYPDQIVYGPVEFVRLVQNGGSVSISISARNSSGGGLNYTVGNFPGTLSQYSIPGWAPIPQTAEPVGGCGNPSGLCPA